MLAALPFAAASPVARLRTDTGHPAPRAIRAADTVADLHLPPRSGKVPAILSSGGSAGGPARRAARPAQLLDDPDEAAASAIPAKRHAASMPGGRR